MEHISVVLVYGYVELPNHQSNARREGNARRMGDRDAHVR